EHLLVAAGHAQVGEVLGQAADGGRVGAAVVVDDDHDAAVLALGDVVERLPGHAAGQRAVADQGDHGAVGDPAQFVGPGQAVGVGQRRGGVRVLDEVVLGLGSRRVPGQAAFLPQLGEVLPPGQDLVHVRLVAG